MLSLLAAAAFHGGGVGPFASAFLAPSTALPSIHQRPSSIATTSPPIAANLRWHIQHPSSSLPRTHHFRTTTTATSTRLHSFFGLGTAELLVIALVGLVLIGPSKLLEFSKEAGEVAGKMGTEMGDEWGGLKSIPEEFQKGVEEGEIEARSRKAKVMEEVGGED